MSRVFIRCPPKVYFIFIHMYVNAGTPGGQKQASAPLELELYIGGCELNDVGAENQIKVFCKSSRCS